MTKGNLLNKRSVRLKLKKSGRFVGVYLYDEEVFLMKQLLIHQSMQSISIHEIYKALSRKFNGTSERTTNAISNRLNVLVQSGILVHRKEKAGTGNVYYYHYRLGKRGVEALIQLGWLSDIDGERIYGYLTRLQIPSNHTKATSLLANKLYLSFLDKEWFGDLEHQRGATHPAFNKDDSIIPDWVIVRDNMIVSMEIDTGSERQAIMSGKFKGYIKKARELIDKELIVIFSVVDSTLSQDQSSNRNKRIASLKDIVPRFTEWPSNLHFYVVNADRTLPLFERILEYAEPTNSFERFTYAEDWIRQVINIYDEKYEVEIINNDEVFRPNRNRDLDCDLVILIKKQGEKPNYLAVTYSEEGSVVTYQLARTNAKRVMESKYNDSANRFKLLHCYNSKDRMENDVFGYSFESSVLLTDSKTWEEAAKGNYKNIIPDVFHISSPYKKEKGTLYD